MNESSKPGPKIHTAANSRRPRLIEVCGVRPTCRLTSLGRKEFARLIGALRAKGLYEKADIGVVSEAARVFEALERTWQDSPEDIRRIGILTSQLRGLRRECGLTLQPSKNAVKPTAQSRWAHLLNGTEK